MSQDPHERDAQIDLETLQRQEYGRWRSLSERKYPSSTPDGFVWSRSRSRRSSPPTSEPNPTDEKP